MRASKEAMKREPPGSRFSRNLSKEAIESC